MDAKGLMAELSDQIAKTANSRAVFGEPIQSGENTIVPVARVALRGGGGGGTGDTTMKGDKSGERGQGTGMGLGLNIAATPVGYINMTPTGAEFVPIVDKGRVLLGAMGVLGMALWVAKVAIMMAGKKQMKR
jgi:uncharacterized spore protein YtfJ